MAVRPYNMQVLADSSTLDQIIDWKMKGPPFGIGLNKSDPMWARVREALTEEQKMQRQFTIELRVDYADEEKNEAMRVACTAAARSMLATAFLLADQTKPQVVIFSDDFFHGHEQIQLLEDTHAKGAAQLASAGDQDTGTVSSELMAAMRDTPEVPDGGNG